MIRADTKAMTVPEESVTGGIAAKTPALFWQEPPSAGVATLAGDPGA